MNLFCPVETRLFVGRLPRDSTEEDLRELFAPYGQIEEITILYGPSGEHRGSYQISSTSPSLSSFIFHSRFLNSSCICFLGSIGMIFQDVHL